MGRTRRAVAVLSLVALAGCEDQEAVPPGTTLPAAALQLAFLGLVAALAWRVFDRRRRRTDLPTAVTGPDWPWQLCSALTAASAALALLPGAWFVAHGAVGYAEETTQVLGWDDTYFLGWILLALGAAVALLQARFAAAVLRRSPVALCVVGVQVVVLVGSGVLRPVLGT